MHREHVGRALLQLFLRFLQGSQTVAAEIGAGRDLASTDIFVSSLAAGVL